jgi:class 3 adenylate cyclase/HAMP domain-containing protein
MKFFKGVKNVFFKVFGKAWWFVVPLSLIAIYFILVWGFPGFDPIFNGVRDGDMNFMREIEMYSNDCFTINRHGTMVLTGYETSTGVATIMDFETGEKRYTNTNYITIDPWEEDYFFPSNFVITDDNVIYAVRTHYYDDYSAILDSEEIVRLNDEYEYTGTVCEIQYEGIDRQRYSKLSRLHYYDNAVTYAIVDESGVYLYSIDVRSQALTQSDFYPTDADGTYTTKVIPIDGSFLFLRSDGNVYRVGFNEPLNEVIYHYDMNAEEISDNPCFDLATLVNGKLYVADTSYLYSVYELENGELTEVFELGDDYSYIVALDSYRFREDSYDSLIVCLDNCILSYYDGELYDSTPLLTFDPTFLMCVNYALGILFHVLLVAIVINLIIRKKTLMYKQLIIILPVLTAITLLIAFKVFEYSDQRNADRINNDITVICDLGKSEFDGFDFTDLMTANKNTGAAYKALNEKFDKLGKAHGHDWSSNYVFLVVYKNDYNDMVVLGGDDMIYTPLRVRQYEKFSEVNESEGEGFVDRSILSFFEEDSAYSTISAYAKINDKNNTGKYYLMVSTDNSSLYIQRNEMFGQVVIYCLLVIIALTLLLVFMCLNTMRIIKKATKTVKEISNGNLSARVNYKSKDELGQICSEVNEMGKSLETMFEEKDKTEQFYYKFVPEKFRELLGKENFTDLSLGDAKSCELTVLFCDIRGFSINSEMMTAKENFAFANIIYGKMGPIVRKNNGFVDKYIGDAVMGLFENADDAVRCGIELYKSIVLDPRTAQELNVSDINIGIGVHTGMAMVGIVGEEERLSGTVISETVNMSSRLESLTKQYKTAMLISKSTLDRMNDPDSMDLRYLGIVQVAGVNEVEALYEVLDCLADDKRAQRSANTGELREAIRLFSLGRRKEAETALKQLKDSGRSDYVTDLYLDYISNMSDDDKGNVFRFSKK